MNVTSLGENLNVVIASERSFAHDWMSFGLWYSINKNMPDAQVFIHFTGRPTDMNLFQWLSKCGVKVSRGEVPGKILLVKPHLVMVRELNNKAVTYLGNNPKPSVDCIELSCEAKDRDSFSPFVDYRNGCGAFNWSEWIDKKGCPYDTAEGFMTHEATFNEVKVLRYWAQLGSLYSTISRG